MNIAQVPSGVTLGEAGACSFSHAPSKPRSPLGYILYVICTLFACQYNPHVPIGSVAQLRKPVVRGVLLEPPPFLVPSLSLYLSRVLSDEPPALCPVSFAKASLQPPFSTDGGSAPASLGLSPAAILLPLCSFCLCWGRPYLCLLPLTPQEVHPAQSCPASTTTSR